ncbi:MAG TPA: hypothetical protein VFD58_33420 [Blastocatellia bacterium]|nr:hypothetical protein [Blastocatellia bacterium]
MKKHSILTSLLILCLVALAGYAQEKPATKAAESKPAAGATGDDKARAKQIIEAAQKAKGPLDKLKAVKDVVSKADATANIQGQSMDLAMTRYLVAPDKSRQEINIAAFGVSIVQVVNGTTGWMDSPQGSGDMPEALVTETRNGILRDWFVNFLVPPEGKSLEATALPDATVNGKAADVVAVTIGETKFTVYFDKETHLIIKTAAEGMNQAMEKVPTEAIYDNYKEVGGIKIAHKATIYQAGEKFIDLMVSDVKINGGVDEAKFKKQ